MNKKHLLYIALGIVAIYLIYRFFFKKKDPVVFSNIDYANKTLDIYFDYNGQKSQVLGWKWNSTSNPAQVPNTNLATDAYYFVASDINGETGETMGGVYNNKVEGTPPIYWKTINWDTKKVTVSDKR